MWSLLCLLIDYSKAFDIINHSIPFQKLQSLDLLSITASIIQGSGIGPSFFIIYSKDLKPLSVHNTILKYADDTSLLVPQNSSITLETELAHLFD